MQTWFQIESRPTDVFWDFFAEVLDLIKELVTSGGWGRSSAVMFSTWVVNLGEMGTFKMENKAKMLQNVYAPLYFNIDTLNWVTWNVNDLLTKKLSSCSSGFIFS